MNRLNSIRVAMIGLLVMGLAAIAPAGDGVKFSVAADTRGAPGFVDVLGKMKDAGGPGQFLITPGDMDPAKTVRTQLDKALGADCAWYPVVGNHEIGSAETMGYLRSYFDSHLKDKATAGPAGTRETTYSFDAGDVHIAVINEYWTGQQDKGSDAKKRNLAPALMEWLKKDLSGSSKPWKIVAGHEPAYPQPDVKWGNPRHINDSLDANPASRDAFWKLLEEQKVNVYLCGHTHRYSRYQPEGSKVWQIDAAQARGDKDWKYDAFILVSADASSLKFDVYRNLKEKGKFEVADTLKLTKE